MTMADPHRNNPESPYCRQPADPIRDNTNHAGEHHWTPDAADPPGVTAPSAASIRQAILDEAAAAITGEREDTYGGPEQSFRTIAALWTTYIGQAIEPYDVAAMMALLKIARIKHSGGQNHDSWVDTAGYVACGAEVAQEAAPKPF